MHRWLAARTFENQLLSHNVKLVLEGTNYEVGCRRKTFTFTISSADEFLYYVCELAVEIPLNKPFNAEVDEMCMNWARWVCCCSNGWTRRSPSENNFKVVAITVRSFHVVSLLSTNEWIKMQDWKHADSTKAESQRWTKQEQLSLT